MACLLVAVNKLSRKKQTNQTVNSMTVNLEVFLIKTKKFNYSVGQWDCSAKALDQVTAEGSIVQSIVREKIKCWSFVPPFCRIP